jgi:hypothetical protein
VLAHARPTTHKGPGWGAAPFPERDSCMKASHHSIGPSEARTAGVLAHARPTTHDGPGSRAAPSANVAHRDRAGSRTKCIQT